eukprot:GHVH01004179.1.p1 GENE.GHVH01004179.1~~GHVH01004179.1.p1  ORF type:complete len:299 (+),score=30.45 GHVH01004179.1:72-968(+)
MDGSADKSWEKRLDNENLDGKSISLWQHVFAGSLAGAVEHVATYPFDVMATRLHFKKMHPTLPLPKFFKGIGTSVLGSIPAHAAMFTCFEKSRSLLNDNRYGVLRNIADPLSSAMSVLAHDMIDAPVTVLKRRLQTGVKAQGNTDTRKEFFRDFIMSLSMKVPENMVTSFLTPYFLSKLEVEKHMGEDEAGKKFAGLPVKGLILHFTAHGLAGAIGSAMCTPFELIRTHQLCNQNNTHCGAIHTGKKIVQLHGVSHLYSGVLPRTIGAFPEAALSWGTFEIVEKIMRRLEFKKNNHVD